MQTRRILALPLLAAAVAAGIWAATRYYAPERAPADSLWAQRFPDPEGQRHALSQWRGQVVVVNFWASWCAPCREEIPDLGALHAQFHGQNVAFVGLAIDDAARVREFLSQTPVGYPILIGGGPAHALSRQLGNDSGALPYTIVFDRDGQVAFSHLGRVSRETLASALRKIGA
jgi:thiol-disulfide isomerase/thioredoxin